MYPDCGRDSPRAGGNGNLDDTPAGGNGGVEMIRVGQVVSWMSRRKRLKKGIVRAIVEPGENLLEKCPDVRFTPLSRSRFQAVSSQRRVLIEEPRDGRGGRHYSKFYAPSVSTVVESQN